MKQLSVIVPIYNVEEYLPECLDSIDQSIRNIDAEVLLIDDGSTDGSSDIAVEFSKKHEPFLYFRKENGGLSDARNYGAKRAKGEIIAFADSDDIVLPGAYENMIRSAEYNQVDLVVMNAARITGKKVWKSTLHNRVFNDLTNLVTHISVCENLLYDTTAWNKLIRRAFWEENEFQYPVGYVFEDMLVSLKMHWKAARVSMVREVGYLWREREGGNLSITQRNDSIENLRDRLKMHEESFDYVDREIGDDDFRKRLIYKVLSFDLMIYLRKAPALDPDKQEEYYGELRSFVDRYYDPGLGHRLFAECRQIYRSLAEGDHERIRDLIDYRKKGSYTTTPVIQTERGHFLDLPQNLFSFGPVDMKEELRWKYPKTVIYKASVKDKVLRIRTACFFKRINMPDEKAFPVKALLEDLITGERIPVRTTPYRDEEITRQYGFSYNRSLKKVFHYNYDGAGAEIEIDLRELSAKPGQRGKYALLICYENECRQGTIGLENKRSDFFEYLDHRVILTGDKRVEILHDPMRRLMLNVSESDSSDLRVDNVPFAVYNMRKDRVIPKGTMIWTVDEIVEGSDQITIKTSARGKKIPAGSPVAMIYRHPSLEADVLISEGMVSDPEHVVFRVRIGDDRFSESLTAGVREPKISVGGESYDLWSGLDEIGILQKDVTSISMFNNSAGLFQMRVRRLRETDSDTIDKRRYMRDFVYREFREKELDDKAIVFSSYTDDRDHGDSGALYDYIDKNYPEYKCVIFLKDEKTPVKGKGIRVRKGSRDYYYHLATAKYFVYDAKPEAAYKKRPGQIEIQMTDDRHDIPARCEKIVRESLLNTQKETKSGVSARRVLKKIFRK